MAGFDPITLEWDGTEYIIPANRVMMAIALIEEHVTFAEYARYAARGTEPSAKLSAAWAAVLNYAGVKPKLTADEVYIKMFPTNADRQLSRTLAINALLGMMMPPDVLRETLADTAGAPADGEGKPPGKEEPTAATSGSSRKPTKRRSASGASGRKTSGG